MTLQEAVDKIQGAGFKAVVEPTYDGGAQFIRGGLGGQDPFGRPFVITPFNDKWMCMFGVVNEINETCNSLEEAADFVIARLKRKSS